MLRVVAQGVNEKRDRLFSRANSMDGSKQWKSKEINKITN